MRALIAFDKFKDSMSAPDACAVAAAALRGCRPEWSLDQCPLADGGDGFVEILTTAAGGELRAVTVTGPRGNPVSARFGLVSATNQPPQVFSQLSTSRDATIAVVEMAAASGLALLPLMERDVWQTTTTGTGELLRAAADAGANAIVLGVGGSATNDLGLGALVALGLRLENDRGLAVHSNPAAWEHIANLGGAVAALPPVFIACDVTNPLLGWNGAAAIYGPQKGLLPTDIKRLDHESARLALLLCAHFRRPDTLMETPGAGAAGGIAFGLMAALDAKLVGGFDFVARWVDLESRLAAAKVVITGEGRFDDSSLRGKGPGAIAQRAIQLGKPVHVFAGAVAVREPVPGAALHAISGANVPLAAALRDGPENLAIAVREVFGAGKLGDESGI